MYTIIVVTHLGAVNMNMLPKLLQWGKKALPFFAPYHALTTEFVGFGPVFIRNSIEEFFSVSNSVRDVTSAGKHCSPCIFISVLDCVCIQNQMSKIIPDIDVHILACFDKGVEECGYFCTGLCNIEGPVLLANTVSVVSPHLPKISAWLVHLVIRS